MNIIRRTFTILCLLILVSGCSPLEVLPGLCYKDKTGTYLCPPEKSPLDEEERQSTTSG